ncbi:rhodanese-like domain-containing protein [Desulfogranum japonicum]|uniref:rhodanese-like domain-containing protein n=1 Tax=Desulfogranum japonicum TaxID=231447 RepID=UPI0004272E25|nr:rhodanese-like domain-containing protein [Desulfogranum japonicum]
MPRRAMLNTLFACVLVSMISYGCAGHHDKKQVAEPKVSQVENKQEATYKGKVVGKSNKAKTISIEVGKGDAAKTVMLKFDEQTQGIDQAIKDHAVIITYVKKDIGLYAVSVKPKLAKLPDGVTEIKTEELAEYIEAGEDIYLVDSRPTSRYGQSHLPDAVSIPVPMLKDKKEALLPEDKNKLLIFYCGGPT